MFFLLSSSALSQNLSRSEKKLWISALNIMEETDQYYRKLMNDYPEMNNDSIWNLQNQCDSINKFKFMELTKLYGYPSEKNIGQEASIILLLRFTAENDFNDLNEIFQSELAKGNMLHQYYEWWYDRCQVNMGKPKFYERYTNQKDFCGEVRSKSNKRD